MPPSLRNHPRSHPWPWSLTEPQQRLALLAALVSLLLLFASTHDWSAQRMRQRASRRPPAELVPRSPVPGETFNSAHERVFIEAAHGLATFSLANHGPTVQAFSVYVPISLDLHGRDRAPVVFALHEAGSDHRTEALAWRAYAERHGWVVISPSMVHAATNDITSHPESLAAFMNVVLDTTLDSRPHGQRRPLGTLLDFSSVLLTARGSAGDAWLAFLLQRPNFWTHASCRDCRFEDATQSQHFEHINEVARGAAESHSDATVKAFWTRYLGTRSLLLHHSFAEGSLETEQTHALALLLRQRLGCDHIAVQSVAASPSDIDPTASWWSGMLA